MVGSLIAPRLCYLFLCFVLLCEYFSYQAKGEKKAWYMFTSEDMTEGYDRKKPAKPKKKYNKQKMLPISPSLLLDSQDENSSRYKSPIVHSTSQVNQRSPLSNITNFAATAGGHQLYATPPLPFMSYGPSTSQGAGVNGSIDSCFSNITSLEGGLPYSNSVSKRKATRFTLDYGRALFNEQALPNVQDSNDFVEGFHPRIKFHKISDKSTRSRGYLSMKDYYSYAFQVREHEGMTPRLGGRLFQQYMVDAYSSIEQTRLWWFRTHQTILRNELYSHICDSIKKGDSKTSNVGKGVILPAGFVGSKRYMQQNFQDALAVCRYVGHPDIFLTMTCNPLWDEIMKMMEYLPGCIASNCPDIISRVFRLKLDQLLTDIKKKQHFGVCTGGI